MADTLKIPRWHISDGDCFETGRGEWMRVDDVEAIFPPDVALMPVPRCDKCRWWTPKRDGFGRCERTHATQWPGPEDDSLATAMASTDPNAEAELCTDASFGCVQFTPKAPTEAYESSVNWPTP